MGPIGCTPDFCIGRSGTGKLARERREGAFVASGASPMFAASSDLRPLYLNG
jgi:hypothetical protein